MSGAQGDGEDARDLPAAARVADLLGAGEVAREIVAAVSSAIGTLYRPRAIRNQAIAAADAEAYATERRATAEARARLIEDDATGTLQARAVARIKARETHRQITLEATIDEALRLAPPEGDAGARRLDPDWTNAFIDHAQEISEADLRRIWARILVQQAKEDQPPVSRATLDSVRLLERSMAQEFERLFRLWIALGQIMDLDEGPEGAININTQDALALTEIGLLRRETREEANLDIGGVILSFHWGARYRPEISATGYGPEHPLFWQAAKLRIDRLIPTWRGQELGAVLFEDLYPRMNAGALDALAPAYRTEEARARVVFDWANGFRARGWEVVLNEVAKRRGTADGGGTMLVPTALLQADGDAVVWRDLAPAERAAIDNSRV